MPPIDIPGYYYDEAKKKYFKIMPSGPHSLAAIKQAQKAAAEEKAEAQAVSQRKHMTRVNLARFCRLRETQVRHRPPWCHVAQGSRSLYQQLAVDTQIIMGRNGNELPELHSALMDITTHPDPGEIILSFSDGSVCQFGYQIDPFFHMWNPPHPGWKVDSALTSIRVCKSFPLHDTPRRTVVGTSLTQLWRYSYPAPLPLSADDAMWLTESAPSVSTPEGIQPFKTGQLVNGVQQNVAWRAMRDCSFKRKKDTFWTSSVNDENDAVLLGSELGLYSLSGQFDLVTRIGSKSAVFASAWLPGRPDLAWIGCRNGSLSLYDTRSNHLSPTFVQSSAITHVVPLENDSSGHLVLAAAMDASIDVWDRRGPAGPRAQPGKKRLPVRQLKGHVNGQAQRLALDVDLSTHLLAAAGSDQRVRLWSLANDTLHTDLPFWSSDKLGPGPIPGVRLISDPPPSQPVWFDHPSSRRSPGLLVCTPDPLRRASIFWLSASSSFDGKGHAPCE